MLGPATLAALLALASPAPEDPALVGGADPWTAAQPGCGEARWCFGIALHVVQRDEELVQTPAWFARQLAEANRHFASIDTGFELASVEALDAAYAQVVTREARDEAGRHRFTRGVVHVFLIERLGDVDAPGEQIRGVHWRQRSKIEKRWIFLSGISSDMVLAHELGHFFSLPHSTYAISIMNKRRRESPPREARTFHPEEIQRMRKARNEMLADQMLVAREK